jgi:hypothetical protein
MNEIYQGKGNTQHQAPRLQLWFIQCAEQPDPHSLVRVT